MTNVFEVVPGGYKVAKVKKNFYTDASEIVKMLEAEYVASDMFSDDKRLKYCYLSGALQATLAYAIMELEKVSPGAGDRFIDKIKEIHTPKANV